MTALLLVLTLLGRPPMPHCEEDAVLEDVGTFHNGEWSAYECGPSVDDFEKGTAR